MLSEDDAEVARHRRVLGTLTDGLVRSARAGGAGGKQAAARLHEHWKLRPQARVQLRPDGLDVDEVPVLETGEKEGRWILPAFMAGLRGFRPRPGSSADDLARLATELGGATSSGASLGDLRDWLWTDGADGIEVNLAASIVEALEATQSDVNTRSAALRAESMAGAQAVVVDARVLDAAAIREEFDVPLMRYAQAASAGQFRLSPADLELLRKDAEDPMVWSLAEIEVVLKRSDFRAGVPADRLVRRLVALLSERGDGATLRLILDLASHEDAWSKTFVDGLVEAETGAVIARVVRLDEPGVSETLTALCAGDPRLAAPLVTGLLGRGNPETERLLGAALATLPADRLRTLTATDSLAPDRAGALVRALVAAGAPAPLLETVAGTLSVAALPTAMTLLPEAVVAKMQGQVRRMLGGETAGGVGLALKLVASSGRPAGWQVVADVLQEGKGQGWTPAELQEACTALATKGYARRFLVAWVRDRAYAPALRVAAIDALAGQAELLREATAFRASEILDPPEVKARLRTAKATR